MKGNRDLPLYCSGMLHRNGHSKSKSNRETVWSPDEAFYWEKHFKLLQEFTPRLLAFVIKLRTLTIRWHSNGLHVLSPPVNRCQREGEDNRTSLSSYTRNRDSSCLHRMAIEVPPTEERDMLEKLARVCHFLLTIKQSLTQQILTS